ncbi:phosphoglycerate mutase [Planoprotostelium fungivorum]|uniref:Phosphoglycerate mutase n=1 Tax=Planoprotostelium fungivorum TaxID=1890364 RepID=A0A2P6N7U1_9EUKA|nr:phosphoglycerate mutase [Planoprotostelium fungivorum]
MGGQKTRVYLVRHGSTAAAKEDRFSGSTDALLADDGIEQAKLLGERLKDDVITAVYASPMKRTIKTAELITTHHKLEIKLAPGLKEIDHGSWEGKTRQEVEEQNQAEFDAWDSDPFTYAPPKGETGLAVLNRALPEIRRIVEENVGGTVLVVSHKATIRLLIGSFLGFDLRRYRDNLDQSPCALNVLDFTLQKSLHSRLILYNDISHYNKNPERKEGEARLSKIWSGLIPE